MGVRDLKRIPPREWAAWLAPLGVYLLIIGFAAAGSVERLNSDGVCYLHRAQLLVAGDVHDSVSGYWSPALIWSTVPLLWMHVDPLHAIHLALFVWGAAFVIGAAALFRTVAPGWVGTRTIAGIATAVAAPRWSTVLITPDVLLGAALMVYLALCLRADLLQRWQIAAAAGVLGGAAYLCKAYGLPFFLVHFPLTVAFRAAAQHPGRGRAWRTLAAAAAGFAIIALPWITIVSAHVHALAFSTAAARNRFMEDMAPADLAEQTPDVSALPPAPFISNMEVTDRDPWPRWSMFDSHAHWLHQLRIAKSHLAKMALDTARLDYAGLAFIAAVLAFIGFRRNDPLSWQGVWLVLTLAIYAGGFLFVVYEPRYVVPIFLPIALAIWLWIGQRFGAARRWVAPCVAVVLVIFVAGQAWATWPVVSTASVQPTYRQIAEMLRKDHYLGVMASDNRERGSCLAFMLNRPFVALGPERDTAALQARLDASGVRVLLRWYDPNYADEDFWPYEQVRLLISDRRWTKRLSIHLGSLRRLDVYTRSTHPATLP